MPELKPIVAANRVEVILRRNEAVDDWIRNEPDAQNEIARVVTPQVKAWFASPLKVGLALAAGKDNAPNFVSDDFGATGRPDTKSDIVSMTTSENVKEPQTRASFELVADGLTLKPVEERPPFKTCFIPREDIQ